MTNVTLLCEEQGKYIANLVSQMKIEGNSIVEPSESAVKEWTDRCNDSSEGKIWLQCNNWYMKGTKDDEKAGRKKSKAMWMESYESYLEYLIGEKGGSKKELLEFS